MFKHYFEQIEGIAIWPMISLTIFFTFFIGLLLWVWKVDKSYIKEMESMPVDEVNDSKLKIQDSKPESKS